MLVSSHHTICPAGYTASVLKIQQPSHLNLEYTKAPVSYFPAILSDPQLEISKKDQNLILGAASSEWMRNRRNILLYLAAIVIWAASVAVGRVLLDHIMPASKPIIITLWILSFILFILGSHYLVFHIRFKPYLYQELRNRGHDICPKCGYILIDIPESSKKCPECGTQRTAISQGQS